MKRYEYNYGKNPEGTLSTISGYATETTNFGETAFGILNKSTRDEENFTTPEVVSSSTATLFSVGNGTDHDSRKNIIELKADGTVYINGVGQYDGTNPGESTNIADEFQGIHDDITGLNEDVDRIDNTIESIHISEDNENLIYTLLVDGQERGTINIPRDQFLKDISYNEETNNLEFIFIVRGEDNEEVEKQVNVNMTDLEDIYSAGDGLNLENKQFSVKIDADTQPYIEVSSNGVKVIGIDEKFNTVNQNVTDLTNRVTTAESDIDAIQDELSNLEGSGEGSVQDQINDALQSYLPLSGGTMNGNIEFASSPDANGYEYVDLGLPSGNLWAKCNIGATNEEEAGLYFQWGDTQGYTAKQVGRGEGYKYFNYDDCKFNSGGSNTYSKYNNSDGKQFLDLEDDAAHVNMGGSWRMPTFADCKELFEYTNVEFLIEAPGRLTKKEESPSTELDDILYYDWEGGNIGTDNSWKYTGIRFSNKNNPDIYIIIPRAGYASRGRVDKSLLESFCWASSLRSESSVNYFGGRYDFCGVSGSDRYYGYPIRGILPKSSNGIIISGKSDQDLLNAAGGTTSIDDITSQVQAAIVDSAPETLDTLNELAAALGDDPNFATTITNQMAQKADKTELPTVQSGQSGTTSNYVYSSAADEGYRVLSDISCTRTGDVVKLQGRTWGMPSNSSLDLVTLPLASSSMAGLMSTTDKSKLDGIDISSFATLDTAQTITGSKTFSKGITINSPLTNSTPSNVVINAIMSEIANPSVNIPMAGGNDFFTIWTGGSQDDGFVVLSSADNADRVKGEPIYIAQLANNHSTDGAGNEISDNYIYKLITLMDASGNQKFNEVTASGYAIPDGTANEVLTADGDSNTLKTINGQTLLGSGDVDMSEFALKTDLDDYLSAGGGTVTGDISVESIEDTNTLTITNTGINISGKTNNDLIAAAGGTTTLKTINGESLLGSGDITIPTPTVNAASGTKTIWTGTQSEYDGISTKDTNTLYFIMEG